MMKMMEACLEKGLLDQRLGDEAVSPQVGHEPCVGASRAPPRHADASSSLESGGNEGADAGRFEQRVGTEKSGSRERTKWRSQVSLSVRDLVGRQRVDEYLEGIEKYQRGMM
ncbi:hypothetical protein CCMA1212_005275 [Trichoderma ghanense]|uniref:Uncharacterized protein n=1 Tax=Trichoderma ghanense TaxID=65468 RepID=A0ABY2H691_9HYPO